MNLLSCIAKNRTETMSSLLIAEITGKRHQDVLRDVEAVLFQAGIEGAQFCAPCKMPSGQVAKVYLLPRRECDLVISGYSVPYRLAIIDRWQELEAKQVIPQYTLPEALRLAADLAEKNAAQATALAIAAPKVAGFDLIATEATGSMCISNAAKHLQVGRNDLFDYLDRAGWIFRRGSTWIAYEPKIQQGVIEHKVTTVTDGAGNVRVCQQALITPKGLAKLAVIISKN